MNHLVVNKFYTCTLPSKHSTSYLEDYCLQQYGNPKEITITNIPIRMNSHGRRVLNKLYEDMEPPEEYFEGSLFDVSCKDPFLLHYGIGSGKVHLLQVTVSIKECLDTTLLVSYCQPMVPFRLQPGWVCSLVNYYSRFPLEHSSTLFTASFYQESRSFYALFIPFFKLVVRFRPVIKETLWVLSYDQKKSSVESLYCIREMYDLEVQRYEVQCPERSAFLKLTEEKWNTSSTKRKNVAGGGGGGGGEREMSLKRKKPQSVINAKQTDLLQGCSKYFSTLMQVYYLLSKGKVKFTEQTVQEYRSLTRTCIAQYSTDSFIDTGLLRKKVEVCSQVIGWLKTMCQLDESLVKTVDKRDCETIPVLNEKMVKQGLRVGDVNVRIYFRRSASGQKQIQVVLESTKSRGFTERRNAKETNYSRFLWKMVVPGSDENIKCASSTSITAEDLFGDSSSEED